MGKREEVGVIELGNCEAEIEEFSIDATKFAFKNGSLGGMGGRKASMLFWRDSVAD